MESKYFRQAISNLNQKYLSADGWDSADWNSAGGFDEQQASLMAVGNEVDASPRPAANAKSLPYIVILENTTTVTVDNVVIFNSAETFNNYTVAGVSITWGYSGISYNTVLGRINSGQVFEIGQMRLVATSSVTGRDELQVIRTVTLFSKTIDGKSMQMQINPQKDSFQNIKNQTDVFYPFMIDSLTGLSFSLLGLTTLNVYLYPRVAANPFNIIKQGAGTVEYANPKTNFSLEKK